MILGIVSLVVFRFVVYSVYFLYTSLLLSPSATATDSILLDSLVCRRLYL